VSEREGLQEEGTEKERLRRDRERQIECRECV